MANVRVAVRVRPLNGKEKDASARNIVSTRGNSLSITNVKIEGVPEFGDSRDRVKHFTFDFCYDSSADSAESTEYASQELVFQDLGTEVLQAAFDGYNACVFAYGQTGTGKTYTMMGYPGEVGLTPRICEGLFSHVDDCPEESITFRVEVSYMEIYNERVRDLLRSSSNPERFTLRVREHPKDGPYVQDLSRHPVKDYHEIQTLLDRGNQLRTTAATHMHEHSSRSHAIVTVNFTQAKLEDGMPSETVSKVHLVDLAGSERADPTYHAAYKGRITEGSNINKSLVTLGNVIKALAEKSLLAWSTETVGSSHSFASLGDSGVGSPPVANRRPRPLYIPYRDSVLTWLLKDSLGGNSKTLMIATITPASNYYNETISTLRYAQRAKSIINKPRINEDPNVALIRQLREENERLKQMLASARMQSPSPSEVFYWLPGGQVVNRYLSYSSDNLEDEAGAVVSDHDSGAILSEKLKENEAFANQLTQSWLEKWNETHSLMKDTDLSIRGLGLGRRSSSYGVIIDSQLPHLIGMDDDILSTGVIIFHLKEGKTLIGREDARCEQDIVLSGPGILAEHCHIKNDGGQVVLYPYHGAQCSINGVPVHEPTPLTQGDVLVLGKTQMYRFNNPAQAAKLRQHRKSLQEGELSSSSSMASITDSEPSRVAPLLMFNPNLDLEHDFTSETERIQQARVKLDRLRAELRAREEKQQEEEEQLWEEHERHRAELEAERIRLAAQVERLQATEHEALESLRQQQEQLRKKEDLYKQELNQKLQQLEENRGADSTAQTDTLEQSSLSIQTEHAASSATATTHTDVADITISGPGAPEIRKRKMSVEGRVKGLAQSELLHTLSLRQATLELKQQEEEMEEELSQSRSEIESRMVQIREKEELYRDADAARLEQIQEKNQELRELQRQEEQLELYLEEKTDLLAVGQAQPRHLRGACSELTLTLADTSGDSFGAHTPRAASEANIADPDEGLIMEASGSESMATDSRESLGSSDNMESAGPAHFDQSQSVGSVDMEHLAPHNLTYSVGSDLDMEYGHGCGDKEDVHDTPSYSALEGRGRGRVRTGRGKARPVQGQGQGKPEVSPDKRITSRAAEVTARLYQAPPPRPDLAGQFLRSKRERGVGPPSPSYSPKPRKSPSPSSASSSPVLPRAKRGPQDSPVLARRHNSAGRAVRLSSEPAKSSRSDLERPSKRSKSETDSKSQKLSGKGKGDEDRDKSAKAKKPVIGGSVQKPTASSLGRGSQPMTSRAQEQQSEDQTGAVSPLRGSRRGTKPVDQAVAKAHPCRGLLSGRSKSQGPPASSKDRQPLSGSDSNLLPGQPCLPSQLRPRPRLRQIVSASSLPSVPEAAAESETDLDSVPLTSDPNMAALVAAVPRRTKRGRGRLSDEEERRHSEPVGDKLAMALAQYTADIESGLGREGLHREDLLSGASLSSSDDHSPARESGTSIPEIHLIEPSSSSSQESFRAGQPQYTEGKGSPTPRMPVDAPVAAQDREGPGDEGQLEMKVGGDSQQTRAGDKRDHAASHQQAGDGEALPKRKRGLGFNQGIQFMDAELVDSAEEGCFHSTPRSRQLGSVGGRTVKGDGDSEGSYSADSLEEQQDDDELDENVGDTTPRPHSQFVLSPLSSASDAFHFEQTIDQNAGDLNFPDKKANLARMANISLSGTHTVSYIPDEDTFDGLCPEEDVNVPGESNVSIMVGDYSKAGRQVAQSADDVLPYRRGPPQASHTIPGPTENVAALPSHTVPGLAHSYVQVTPGIAQHLVIISPGPESVAHIHSIPRSAAQAEHREQIVFRQSPRPGYSDTQPTDGEDVSAEGDIHSASYDGDLDIPAGGTDLSLAESQPTTHSEAVTSQGETLSVTTDLKLADKEAMLSEDGTPSVCKDFSTLSADAATSSADAETVTPSSGTDLLFTPGSTEVFPVSPVASGSSEVPMSVEVLNLLVEGEGSQLSDEASPSVEQQLQALQEVLHQLSPRASAAAQASNSGTTPSGNGRRCKRRQHLRQLRGSDSDNAEHVSNESVPSGGNNSRSSSRPSSGSRRRRRPANKSAGILKKRHSHSSEEYVTSDNDSVYSDDSLTHSSERQDVPVSQVSTIQESLKQLTAGLQTGDTDYRAFEKGEAGYEGDMEGERASVPALVTYFESQVPGRSKGHDRRDERRPSERRARQSREASVASDDGNVSATEGTQTEGSSVSMGKAPVYMWSAGDPNHVPPHSVQDMSGSQTVQEETSVRAQSHRSWKLSVTPTDVWDSNIAENGLEPDVQLRRKLHCATPSPEKRMRQDKLTDLHSKYGLLTDDNKLSDDENSRQEESTPGKPPEQTGIRPVSGSSAHKKMHAVSKDDQGKLHFELTINQDETNIKYNVEKTEYRTYTLGDREGVVTEETTRSTFPDTININLTETTTLQREDRFETITKERVLFSPSGTGCAVSDDLIQVEHKFSEGHMLEFEQDREEGSVSRESSVERHLTDEDSSSNLQLRGSQSSVTNLSSPLTSGSPKAALADNSLSPSSSENTDRRPSSQTKKAKRSSPRVGGDVSDADSREGLLGDGRCSDSSSPGPHSTASWPGGQHSDHTCDSDVPPDSGVTEISTSEGIGSHDEDGTEGAANWDASSPGLTAVSAVVAGAPHQVFMQREDISNTFLAGHAGAVAGQLQQVITLESPSGIDQTEGIADHSEGLTVPSSVQHETYQQHVLASTPREALPGTPLNAASSDGSSLGVSPESHLSASTSRSSLQSITNVPATQSQSDQDASETVSDQSNSECSLEQRMEIPVVHQTAEMDSFSERIASSRDLGNMSTLPGSQTANRAGDKMQMQTDTERAVPDVAGDVQSAQTFHETLASAGESAGDTEGLTSSFDNQPLSAATKRKMETGKVQGNEASPPLVSDGALFVSADMWVDTRQSGSQGRDGRRDRRVEAGQWLQVDQAQQLVQQSATLPAAVTKMPSQFSTACVSVTDPVKQVTQQAATQTHLAVRHQREAEEKGVSRPDLVGSPVHAERGRNLARCHLQESCRGEGQPDGARSRRLNSHPAVNEIPFERAGHLLQDPVEYGPQSPLMYPYCRDGLLLYTSSQCRQEPYAWIETFHEEAGLEVSVPDRRRLTSEEIAESMLAEVKRKNEEPWQNEDAVFTEVTEITADQQQTSAMDVDDRRDVADAQSVQGMQHGHAMSRLSDGAVSEMQHRETQASADNIPSEFHGGTQPSAIQRQRHGLTSTPVPGSVDQEIGEHLVVSPSQLVPGGCLSLASEDSLAATEDSFYSPDTTAQSANGSSESSVYRTPQQSPREQVHHSASASEWETPESSVAEVPSSALSRSYQDTSSSPVHDSRTVCTGSSEVAGQTSVLSAMAVAVGNPVVGNTEEVEAMREVLKQEVERKIASLQRRVRSLSDSAISSDFTEPESTSVSPRNSRFREADGKPEALTSEVYPLNYLHQPVAAGGTQEVFMARTVSYGVPEQAAIPIATSQTATNKKTVEKSLADSGNIHDDEWQDTVEESPRETQKQSGVTAPGQKLQTADGLSEQQAAAITEMSSVQLPATSPTGPQPATPVELSYLSGRFPERVVNAVLSLPQSWPDRVLASPHRHHRRRRGMIGKRSKSLGDLDDVLVNQQRSDLEENLREQARIVLQAVAAREGMDTVTSMHGWDDTAVEGTDFGEGELAVEWVNGHFHPAHRSQGSLVPHHPHPVTDGITHAWLVSAERATEEHLPDTDGDHQKIMSHSGQQGVTAGISIAQMSGPLYNQLDRQSEVSAAASPFRQVAQEGSAVSTVDSIKSTGSTFGSSKTPSLSEMSEEWDRPISPMGDRYSRQQSQSPEAEEDSLVSDDRLLSSGELEVAAINARAAVCQSQPFTDSDADSRPLSPGEQILADILARQRSTVSPAKSVETSDASSPRNWARARRYKAGKGSGSPRRQPSSMHDRNISPGELVLSEETILRLRDARVELSALESLDDLLQSAEGQDLQSEDLTFAQNRMLLQKSFSTSNIGAGHYAHEEDEMSSYDLWQMDRPASLACLEGIADDSSEDSDGSGDSICFVFVSGGGANAAPGPLGGSITSDGSERQILQSRSTESIPRDLLVDRYVPPLAERSASLDDMHASASVRVQRKEQLHRSRSASLLDVATSMYDEPDEQVFPPQVCSESETSWDGQTSGPVEDELSSQDAESAPGSACLDASTEVSTIVNPMFAHRSSLVEHGHDQQYFKTSPDHHFVDGILETRQDEEAEKAFEAARDGSGQYQGRGKLDGSHTNGSISEVESGQPYFKYRTPGARPQQSESGCQTDMQTSIDPQFNGRLFHTDAEHVGQLPSPGSPLMRSQSTGSLNSLHLSQATITDDRREAQSPRGEVHAALPLSPGSERWLELSHLMLETTQILRSLQHTLPSRNRAASLHSSTGSLNSLTSPKGHSSGTQTAREDSESAWTQTDAQPPQRERSTSIGTQSSPVLETKSLPWQRQETGTQTPTFSPRQIESPVTVGGYPGYLIAPELQRIVIKVKDALTQTSASLGDLSSAEVQTDDVIEDLASSLQRRLKPLMRDASSSVENMHMTDMTCQTEDLSSVTAETTDGMKSHLADTTCQTDKAPVAETFTVQAPLASSLHEDQEFAQTVDQSTTTRPAAIETKQCSAESSTVESAITPAQRKDYTLDLATNSLQSRERKDGHFMVADSSCQTDDLPQDGIRFHLPHREALSQTGSERPQTPMSDAVQQTTTDALSAYTDRQSIEHLQTAGRDSLDPDVTDRPSSHFIQFASEEDREKLDSGEDLPTVQRPLYRLVSVSTQMAFDADHQFITLQDGSLDGRGVGNAGSSSSLERGSLHESGESASSDEDTEAAPLGKENIQRMKEAFAEAASSYPDADQALAASIATFRQNQDVIQGRPATFHKDQLHRPTPEQTTEVTVASKGVSVACQFSGDVQTEDQSQPAVFVLDSTPLKQDAAPETQTTHGEKEHSRFLEDAEISHQSSQTVPSASASVDQPYSISTGTQVSTDINPSFQHPPSRPSSVAGLPDLEIKTDKMTPETAVDLFFQTSDMDKESQRETDMGQESTQPVSLAEAHLQREDVDLFEQLPATQFVDSGTSISPQDSFRCEHISAHTETVQSGEMLGDVTQDQPLTAVDAEHVPVDRVDGGEISTATVRELTTQLEESVQTAEDTPSMLTEIVQPRVCLPPGHLVQVEGLVDDEKDQGKDVNGQENDSQAQGKPQLDETPGETPEAVTTECPMAVEVRPTVTIPTPATATLPVHHSHAREHDAEQDRKKDGRLGWRTGGSRAETRWEESLKRSPRSFTGVIAPDAWADEDLDDSFSQDELFSSDARQRAAWRARIGDYDLGGSTSDSRSVHSGLCPPPGAVGFPQLQPLNVMSEIEHLRQEHARMMQLLERSRNRSPLLLSPAFRTRSASPRMTHAGSGSSSSGGSPVTVIARQGSIASSPVTVTASQGAQSGAREDRASGLTRAGSAYQQNMGNASPRSRSYSPSSVRQHREPQTSPHADMESAEHSMQAVLSPAPAKDSLSMRQLDSVADETVGSQLEGTSPQPSERELEYAKDASGTAKDVDAADSTVMRLSTAESGIISDEDSLSPRRGITLTDLSQGVMSPRSDQQELSSRTRETSTYVSPRMSYNPFSMESMRKMQDQLEVGQPPLDTRNVSATTNAEPSYSAAGDTEQSPRYSTLISPRSADNPFSVESMRRIQDQLVVSQPPLDTRDRSATTNSQPVYSAAGDTEQSPRYRGPQDQTSVGIMTDLSSLTEPMDDVLSDSPPTTSASPVTVVDVTEVSTTPDVLVDTPRSPGRDSMAPLHHLFPVSPSRVSTGVEAAVDSSDDFTQTDDEGSLHLSQLDASAASFASSGDSETRRIRAELDRLHQERVEIIELLSLQYLPASLTVELLEAKLNYCLGQTDMLLASLEDSWAREELSPKSRHSVDEEYLVRYRQQFEQSRRDLKVCMEEARRLQNGTRGRRMARTRDIIAMKRRAEIEAFKLERHREQVLYDRTRNFSPASSTDHTAETMSESEHEGQHFDPRFMTPKQHKEHLVRLRRSLVAASTEELNELRHRSTSSGSYSPSPDRSLSPLSSSCFHQSRDSSFGSSLSPERHPPSFQPFPRTQSDTRSAAQSTPKKVPRLVVPRSDPTHHRGHSFPRGHHAFSSTRSSSWGPTRHTQRDTRYLSPPLEDYLDPIGYTRGTEETSELDPEQLLAESYAARQLNQEQISKAQQALQLLEAHRRGFSAQLQQNRSGTRPHEAWKSHIESDSRDQAVQREIDVLQQQHSQSSRASTGHDVDSGVMSLETFHESSNVPPDSTSTPRSSDSFAAYARDILARNERHIQTIVAHSNTSDDHPSRDPSYDADLSLSGTPSSLQSTDLDSFLNSTASSTQQSTPRFMSTRPISSQDIKARIARRLLERSKTKK